MRSRAAWRRRQDSWLRREGTAGEGREGRLSVSRQEGWRSRGASLGRLREERSCGVPREASREREGRGRNRQERWEQNGGGYRDRGEEGQSGRQWRGRQDERQEDSPSMPPRGVPNVAPLATPHGVLTQHPQYPHLFLLLPSPMVLPPGVGHQGRL